MTLFDSVKLVAPEISLGGNFSFDINGHFYSTTTVYGYIKKEMVSESYLTVMGIMNSKLLWWYLVNTGTVLANGYFRFKPNYLFSFPIPIIDPDIELKISSLVEKIIEIPNKRNNDEYQILNDQLDETIYTLYNLDKNDCKYIINSLLKA